MLYEKFEEKNVHLSLLDVALQVTSGEIKDVSNMVLLVLKSFKQIIRDFEFDDDKKSTVGDKLRVEIESAISFTKYFTGPYEGLERFYTFLNTLFSMVVYRKDVKIDELKKWVLEKLNEFIMKKIIESEDFIVDSGVELLKDVKTIMIYSFSSVLQKIL